MATNKRNQSNKKVAGVSYEFEGRHMESEQIVRGEVVAKDEQDARAKLARRRVKVISLHKKKKVRKENYPGRHYCIHPPAGYYDESRPTSHAGIRYCGKRPLQRLHDQALDGSA